MIAWSGIFHILAPGISGVTILGIAGEAHRLADEERRPVVDTVVKEVAGRVPVVGGVSAPRISTWSRSTTVRSPKPRGGRSSSRTSP